MIVVLGVLWITLGLFRLLPFSPARAILGARASQGAINAFNQEYGWNSNIFVQYWDQIRSLVQLNFGSSQRLNSPVWSLISTALPRTLMLVGIATLVALIIAIPLGVIQVLRRNKPIDYALTGGSFVFYAMPTFFLGVMLVNFFAIDIKIFTYPLDNSSTVGQLLASPRQLVLPVFTLAAVTIAGFSRYMRSSMMEQMTEDYVRTARAKGLRNRRVVYVHALRNALIPIVTLLGLALPGIVSGAVITEIVFNYPGMGLLFFGAVTNLDYPLLIGTVLVGTVATVIGSLIADILYAVLDPRIRYG